MAEWTHAICEPCYDLHLEENDWPELPARVKWEAFEKPELIPARTEEDGCEFPEQLIYAWCCFCRDGIDEGWGTPGVIYVRRDPALMSCSDLHEEESHD